MEKISVRLDGLSIGYHGKHGLNVVAKDINETIRGGELTCLLGANGAGKSTLLRTLSAFLPKLEGNVYIGGREIGSFDAKELARTIGIVLTEKPEVANMTVREMVLMGRSPYTGFWGTYSDSDNAVVDEAINMVGIGHIAGRLMSSLSDGERQKVMIAKALAQQTPVIYLDEPTAFLDFPSKVEVMKLLHRISRESGKVVFLSTHDLELALQLADTVWLMDKGHGICAGTPEDLALDGTLPAFYSGRGIVFDKTAGVFRADCETVAAVRLTGVEGVRRAMAAKALRRNGYATDAADSAFCEVEVTGKGFVVGAVVEAKEAAGNDKGTTRNGKGAVADCKEVAGNGKEAATVSEMLALVNSMRP